MKPHLLLVGTDPACSFSVRQDKVPYINNTWHYHAEIELIHFCAGHGTQFVGDNIKPFQSGDVVLVGSQIPHYWSFSDIYFNEPGKHCPDVRVAHFRENFWGPDFLDLPENTSIKSVLQRAKRGIQVYGKTKEALAACMEKMLTATGTRKILLLLEALVCITDSTETELLSSIGFRYHGKEGEGYRINEIYQFSLTHYKRKITIGEVAGIANMSGNAFCRYFKSRTNKTYTDFLIEIRVRNGLPAVTGK